jgi:hypothetical protein
MQHLVDIVIAALRSENPAEIRERLLEARLFIEKSVGTWGSWKGISRSVDEAGLSNGKLLDLRVALLRFAQEHREHSDVGSAIWALGAFRDESLRDFFLTEMRFHLQARRHHPVAQAHSALLDLGDDGPIYDYAPGETSHDGYFEAVRAYLDERGA